MKKTELFKCNLLFDVIFIIVIPSTLMISNSKQLSKEIITHVRLEREDLNALLFLERWFQKSIYSISCLRNKEKLSSTSVPENDLHKPYY